MHAKIDPHLYSMSLKSEYMHAKIDPHLYSMSLKSEYYK